MERRALDGEALRVIQSVGNLLDEVRANVKRRLIRDRPNECPGLPEGKSARPCGPQNDAERTGDLAPHLLSGTPCGEIVAQQNQVGTLTPERECGELSRVQVLGESFFGECS